MSAHTTAIGSSIPAASSRAGSSRRWLAGLCEVAQCQLDPSQYAEGVNGVVLSYQVGDGKGLTGGEACLFDEPEIGLDQSFDPADPRPTVHVLGLLGELVCLDGVLDRPRPAASQPLELAQHP